MECQVILGGLHVQTAIFRDRNGTFIDPDRASELANDIASTRLFLEERGVDPASLLQIRNRLLPPRLMVKQAV